MQKHPNLFAPLAQALAEIFSHTSQKRIETHKKSRYDCPAFAKSEAERRNSNCLQLANNDTPLACFSICSFRTPIHIDLSNDRLCPMVACSGKGSPFAVFQLLQFSTPLHVTAQSVETFAVTSAYLQLELSAMIYTFLCVHRNQPTYTEQRVSVEAPNLNEARWRLPADYRLILESPVARLPVGSRFADFHAKPTACNAPRSAQAPAELFLHTSQKRIETHKKSSYDCRAFAKNESTALESWNLSKAHNTPKACFFMRDFRTPQKRPVRFSMVERSRKGFALCCNPLTAVFQPVTFYRPTLESLAVVSKNLSKETISMLFKFLLLGSKRLTISIRANTEQEARQCLQFTAPALCVARYNQASRKPQAFAHFSEDLTACNAALFAQGGNNA